MQKMVCNHFLSCFCCVLFWWILIAFTEVCAFEYMNDWWWVWWCWMSVVCVNLSLCSSVDSRSNSHGCFNRSVQPRKIFRNTSPKVKCFFRLGVSILPLNKFEAVIRCFRMRYWRHEGHDLSSIYCENKLFRFKGIRHESKSKSLPSPKIPNQLPSRRNFTDLINF